MKLPVRFDLPAKNVPSSCTKKRKKKESLKKYTTIDSAVILFLWDYVGSSEAGRFVICLHLVIHMATEMWG